MKFREDVVTAKGKGRLQTYWILFKSKNGAGASNNGVCDTSNFSDSADNATVPSGNTTSKTIEADMAVEKMPSISSLPTSSSVGPTDESDSMSQVVDQRLIEWNVDVLQVLLKKIIAVHSGSHKIERSNNSIP